MGMRTLTLKRMLKHFGFKWYPTMGIGTGCRVHMVPDELPPVRMIVNLSKHVAYVDNTERAGWVLDTHDPSRGGTRCVFGFWTKDRI